MLTDLSTVMLEQSNPPYVLVPIQEVFFSFSRFLTNASCLFSFFHLQSCGIAGMLMDT